MVQDKEVYFVKNASGKFKADFISTNKDGFSLLKIGAPVNGTDKLAFTVPNFGDVTQMKVGQQVLVLGTTVASSIFEGLDANKNIDLMVSRANAGALVLDLDGDALGIALSPENTVASFASIQDISNALTPTSTTATTPTSTPITTQ